MTRYKRGKARSANNQKRRKGHSGTSRGPGRNSGTAARIRNERRQESR